MGVFWHGQFCFPLQRAGQGLVVVVGPGMARVAGMMIWRSPVRLLIAFGIFAWPCTTYTTTAAAPGHTHTHALTHSHSLTEDMLASTVMGRIIAKVGFP
jgi:hypothetical protein